MGFAVTAIRALRVRSRPPLRAMYKLSPFVWKSKTGYEILIRAVPRRKNPAEKIARIYYGRSRDGITFEMAREPAIAPGPGEDDAGGCEDPTLATVGGTRYLYYTGWNERLKRGQLLLASGRTPMRLTKRGVALASSPGCENPKEATIVQAADGTWRLFFEFAQDDASMIGVASSDSVAGPWSVQAPPFERRTNSWDAWHLSTGPICTAQPDRPVMLYNGATRDAAWRIGWVAFDPCYTRVVDRCIDPLLAPSARRAGDATDIAFAASAIDEGDEIRLYYSIADKDMYCAFIRRV